MNRKFGIAILFLACYCFTSGQDFKIDFQTGVGFYKMNSFSELMNWYVPTLPFDAKVVTDFPPYPYYQPMLKAVFKNSEIGLVYLYQTTGSRISSKDYSGEYRLDTKINSHSPGIVLNGFIRDYRHFRLGLYIQTGYILSALKMDEYIRVADSEDHTNYTFKSTSIYLEPGVGFHIPFKSWSLQVSTGYFKEFLRKDYHDVSGDGEISVDKNFDQKDVWDGWRCALTVGYTFGKKQIDSAEK